VDIDTPIAGVQFDLPSQSKIKEPVAAAHAEEDAARETYQADAQSARSRAGVSAREFDLRREQYLRHSSHCGKQAIEISNISRSAYQAGGLDLLRLLDAERARSCRAQLCRALEGFHLNVADLTYRRSGSVKNHSSRMGIFALACCLVTVADMRKMYNEGTRLAPVI